MMKPIILVTALGTLLLAADCSSTPSQDDIVSDENHSFSIVNAAIYDKIGDVSAPKEKGEDGEEKAMVFLVVKYQVESVKKQEAFDGSWMEQLALKDNKKEYAPASIDSINSGFLQRTLPNGEGTAEYAAFTVPDGAFDYSLVITFPTSNTEATYSLNVVDKRISSNTEWVINKLRQISNSEKIPLLGSFSKLHPIRYRGIILVKKEEISSLMERTKDLKPEEKEALIEEFLVENGHCQFE